MTYANYIEGSDKIQDTYSSPTRNYHKSTGLKNQLQITSVARNYLQGHVHQSGAEESVSMRHQHLLFSYNIHELL
jgi:hypothetical protein